MFKRMAEAANRWDRNGNYEDADLLTSALLRIAATLGPTDKKKIEEHFDNIKQVSNQPTEDDISDIPDVNEPPLERESPDDPFGLSVIRPGLKDVKNDAGQNIMHPMHRDGLDGGYDALGLDISTPENREAYLKYLNENTDESDLYANVARFVMSEIEKALANPIRKKMMGTSVVSYGDLLLKGQLLRTILQSSNPGKRTNYTYGGRHMLTPIMRDSFQALKTSKTFENLLKFRFNNVKKNLRMKTLYMGGNTGGGEPNINMDLVISRALENYYRPYEKIINHLITLERADKGYDMNTTSLKPGQYRAMFHSDYQKLNPANKNFDMENIYHNIQKNFERFSNIAKSKKLDIPYEDLRGCAMAYLFLYGGTDKEGKKIGGLKTFKSEDTVGVKAYAPNNGKNNFWYNPNSQNTINDISDGLINPRGVGEDYQQGHFTNTFDPKMLKPGNPDDISDLLEGEEYDLSDNDKSVWGV